MPSAPPTDGTTRSRPGRAEAPEHRAGCPGGTAQLFGERRGPETEQQPRTARRLEPGVPIPPEEPPAAAVTSSRAPPPCRRPGTRLRGPFLSAPQPSAAVPVPAAGRSPAEPAAPHARRGESGTAPAAARPRGGAAGLSRPGVRAPGGAAAAAPPQPRAPEEGPRSALTGEGRVVHRPPAGRCLAPPSRQGPRPPACPRGAVRELRAGPAPEERAGRDKLCCPSVCPERAVGLRAAGTCRASVSGRSRATPSKTSAKSPGVSSILNGVWVSAYLSRRHTAYRRLHGI